MRLWDRLWRRSAFDARLALSDPAHVRLYARHYSELHAAVAAEVERLVAEGRVPAESAFGVGHDTVCVVLDWWPQLVAYNEYEFAVGPPSLYRPLILATARTMSPKETRKAGAEWARGQLEWNRSEQQGGKPPRQRGVSPAPGAGASAGAVTASGAGDEFCLHFFDRRTGDQVAADPGLVEALLVKHSRADLLGVAYYGAPTADGGYAITFR